MAGKRASAAIGALALGALGLALLRMPTGPTTAVANALTLNDGTVIHVWRACRLPHRGELDAQDCTVTQSAQPGVVTFGPYAERAPGRYRFRLRYKTSGPGGRWDAVATDGAAFTDLGRGTLPETSGRWGQVGGLVELNGASAGPNIEIRTYGEAQTQLVVERLWIEHHTP